MSEYLAGAAQKLGAPEELVERSARARAAAQGVDADAILAAWAGGEAPPAAQPTDTAPDPATDTAPDTATDTADPTPSTDTPTDSPEPTPSTPAAEPTPVAAAPTAGAVVVAARPDAAPVLDARRQSGVLMLLGIAAMFVVGVLISFVVPAAEGGDDRHVVRVPELEALAESGREVYVQEGCWYCHTQQVRAVVADVGLGPATERGSESLDAPALTGVQRIGPDLTLFSYSEGASVELVMDYLAHPEDAVEDSNHPGYGFLSDEDLVAVATYVMADKVDIPRETEEGENDE